MSHFLDQLTRIDRRRFLQSGSALGLAAAAGLAPWQQALAAGGTLRAGMVGGSFVSLDPGKASAAPDFWILWAMFNGLTKFDKDMNIVPDLAESWQNPDPVTWVFKLRQGVKFHDGNEMTADDVKFTLDRVRDEAFGSPNRSKLASVEEIRVVDPYTVEIKTKQPFAPLLTYLTNTRSGTQIVSRKAVESGSQQDFAKRPIGTGAFKMVEWRPNEKVVLAAHKDYFVKDLPHLDMVEIPLIAEESTAVSALLANNVDLIGRLPFDQVQRLEKTPSVTVYKSPGMNCRYMALNLKRPPFDDVHFRRALSMGFDRNVILQAVLFGEGVPSQGNIPPSLSWAFDTEKREVCTFNPGKAKAELAQSKYKTGAKAVVLTWGSSFWRRWGELFTAQVNQTLGTNLTIEVSDANTANQRFLKGDYDALTWGYTGLTEADEYLSECFHTRGWRNTGGYSNPEADKLLDQARQELDRERRGKLYIQAERMLAEEVPAVFTFHANVHQAFSKRVQGYQGLPYEGFGAQFAPVTLT